MRIEGPRANRNGGVKNCLMIGCGSALVIFLVVSIGGYFWVKGFAKKMVDTYTQTQPLTLPTVNMPEEAVKATLERFAVFSQALRDGRPAEKLVLSGDEVNVIIQQGQNKKEWAGKAYVEPVEDKINGQVSIPLNEMGGIFVGRYLNGSGTFAVSLINGLLYVNVVSLEVGGKPVPEAFMSTLRQGNLAEKMNTDPEAVKILRRIKEISVEGGNIVIVPVALK